MNIQQNVIFNVFWGFHGNSKCIILEMKEVLVTHGNIGNKTPKWYVLIAEKTGFMR